MHRRRFLAALGVGLAGCTSLEPSSSTNSPASPPTDPPTDSPTGAPTPTEGERPTATPRDPDPLSVSGSWAQFGADPGHSGASPNAGVPGDAEPYWHLQRIRSGPAVLADGRLFHYAKLGADTRGRSTITRTLPSVDTPALTGHEIYGQPSLLARNASDGRIEWSVPLDGPGVQWPAVADGRVVVGVNGQLAAFDAAEGRALWGHDLDGRNVDDPTIAGDAVVVPIDGAVNGRTGKVLKEPAVRVHGLADGSLRWTVRPPKRANDVAVADSTVIVVSGGWDGTGVVLALSLANGSERWRAEIPGDSFRTPVVADGTVFVASSNNDVQALALEDGSEQWRRTFERRPGGIAADADAVFVGAGWTLYSLAAGDGSVRWTANPGSENWGSFVTPAVGDRTVYAGTSGGRPNLFAFDASDGTERWSYSLPDRVVDGDMVMSGTETQPIVADGAVYVSAVDGLYAFGPSD